MARHELIKEYPRKIQSQLPKKFRKLSWEETLHIEGGCRYLLNINEVYFSSKLGYERERVTKLLEKYVEDEDAVAVLFAGIGPYAIHIAKHLKKDIEIYAVELNPRAIEYLKKNIELNKIPPNKIKVIEGDVKDFLLSSSPIFKALILPAPKDAPNYFDLALHRAKPKALIILYTFASREDIENKTKEKEITSIAQKEGKKIKIISSRKCGSVGANTFRYAIDIEVI